MDRSRVSRLADEYQCERAAGGDAREALGPAIGDVTNVLLLAPLLDPRADEGCAKLLSVAPPEDENVLWVTLAGSPDDRLDAWRTHVGEELPAEAGFVDVGGAVRASGNSKRSSVADGDVSVATVASPADLTGIGIEISIRCSRWTGDENEIAVCVNGLSTLLQFVDGERAFRFLHEVTGRLSAIGATAHFHLDPSVHDDRTVNTLAMVFDAVVVPGDDGWNVARR